MPSPAPVHVLVPQVIKKKIKHIIKFGLFKFKPTTIFSLYLLISSVVNKSTLSQPSSRWSIGDWLTNLK